jgi:hypothetical protein
MKVINRLEPEIEENKKVINRFESEMNVERD